MIRRTLITIISALAMAAPAAAWPGNSQPVVTRTVKPMTIFASAGAPGTGCSQRVPDSWSVSVDLYVNGKEILPTQGQDIANYYAGHGTLVQLTPEPHGGPICGKVMTWQTRVRVRVVFQVLP